MKDSPMSGGKPASTKRAKGGPIGTHNLTGVARDDAPADHVPTPDEDGPHDVPDEKVIEKTLPSVPVSDSPAGGSGQMRR